MVYCQNLKLQLWPACYACGQALHGGMKDKTWPVQAVNTQVELEDTIQPAVLAVSEQELQCLKVFFLSRCYSSTPSIIFVK
jgi:hypothetical protein